MAKKAVLTSSAVIILILQFISITTGTTTHGYDNKQFYKSVTCNQASAWKLGLG